MRNTLITLFGLLLVVGQAGAQLSDSEMDAEPPRLVEGVPPGHEAAPLDGAEFEDLIPEAPEGAVAWQSLREVTYGTKRDPAGYDVVTYTYPEAIQALDNTEVRILGYMLPMFDVGHQGRFLLAAYPPSCPYCLPAGPSQLIDVHAEDPLEFDWDPVLIEGVFHVLEDDPQGLMYRITGARAGKS